MKMMPGRFVKKSMERVMNRHDRRAAKMHNVKEGDVIVHSVIVHRGNLLEHDPNYGQPVICYVCDVPHKALGFARIEDQSSNTFDTFAVPLCQSCASAITDDAVLRKFWNVEAIQALLGKQMEH